MTAADPQRTHDPSDFDELDAVRGAHGIPPFSEGQNDRDPIKAKPIPAAWGTTRIIRHIRKIMRRPGEYEVSFTGRISPPRVRRIVGVINKEYSVWEGGAGMDYEHHAGGLPMIALQSNPHGPHQSEIGEPLPWGGIYSETDLAKGIGAQEIANTIEARRALAPRPGVPPVLRPAARQTRERLSA